MNPTRVDRLAMILSQRTTRRTALGLLAALGLTGLVREAAAAACQGGTGGRCGRPTDLACCSGRCVRKRGTRKKVCRKAPSQGICTIQQDVCTSGSPNCATGADRCLCRVTTQGHSFCAGGHVCVTCETNADCETRDGGRRGHRCTACAACPDSNGRACAFPCQHPAQA
jgi:hypothetical protein